MRVQQSVTSQRRADEAAAAERRRLAVGDHPARLRLDASGTILASDGLETAVGVPADEVLGVHGNDLVAALGRSIDFAGPPEVEDQAHDDQVLRIAVAGGDDLLVFSTPAAADEQHGAGTWVYLVRQSRR